MRWLAQQAEALGVEIFPGFAAAEVLYDDDGAVAGVATGNMGIGKDGEPTDNFQLGMELHAKYTLFAEGARGHLGRQLIASFKLDDGRDPQTYGIGIKELWEVDPAQAQARARRAHRRLAARQRTPTAAAFLYHLENNQVSIGFVVGLDYTNPYLSPFEEFQRYKTHPGDPLVPRRRQAPRLRRARDHRGRPAVAAEAGVPGRRAGRLRRRLPQRAAHQGQPRRDQDRHAGRRGRLRRGHGRPPAATSSPPTRPRSRRAGCTTSCTGRATSSRGSTRA